MRVAVVLGCLFAACASQQGFINDKTVWIVATSDWKQGSAFFSALEDVRRDWYAVVGSRPVVVSELPEDTAPHVTENITSIVFGTPSSDFVKNASLPSKCKQGWESHCIVRISDPHFGGHRLIVTGADLRGSIFAAYTVSENLLGIGPLDFWLQIRHEMVRNVLIDNVSAAFPIFIPSPAFKYRAMFVNDEDLLGGLRNDPMRQSVWSIDTWDALYSTSLRLKANSVLPGTNIFPDNPAYSLAARRGLAFSSHHYNILGLSPVAQSVATWFPEAYNFQLRYPG